MPAASTAASARSTSARSSETGFSQNTALPAAAAATSRSACESVLEQTAIASASRDQLAGGRRDGHPELGGGRIGDGVVRVEHAGDRGAGDAAREQPGVQAADPADADHADPQRCDGGHAHTSSQRPEATLRRSASWTAAQASAASKPGANGRPAAIASQNAASSIVTRSS